MEKYLFEQPWWTVAILALAEVALAAAWHSSRRRTLLLAAIAPPVLAAAAILAAYLVKTDRERIAEAMAAVARAVESGNLDGAELYLDRSVRAPLPAGSMGRREILARGQSVLKRYPVRWVSLEDVKTAVNGPNATTEVTTAIDFAAKADLDSLRIGWRLQWALRPEGWRLTRIELVKPFWLAAWDA